MTKRKTTEQLGDIRDSITDEETGEVLATAYKPPFLKTPWNHDTTTEAMRTGTVNLEPTMTQQSQAEETDINVIMKKFGVGGQVALAPIPPTFMDVPEMDMMTALNLVHEAQDAFMAQPAETRALFHNDMTRYHQAVDAAIARGDIGYLRGLNIDVPETPEEAREKARQATAQAAAKKTDS